MANPLNLTALQRAAVERNTMIVRVALSGPFEAGPLDPEDLPGVIAMALTQTASELRAKGQALVDARKQGHKSTNDKLNYAASELLGIAQSLLADGVDDELWSAFRGPDVGEPQPAPEPKDVLDEGFSPTGSGMFVCGHGHGHTDVYEAARYGCVADPEAVLTNLLGAEDLDIPLSPAMLHNDEEGARRAGYKVVTERCVCPRGERQYCELLNCQGGADIPIPLDVVQAVDLDSVNAARLAVNTLIPPADALPEEVPTSDHCGALPWQGPAAHGPCVVAAGHIERGVLKHVAAGGKDMWSDPPADWLPTETEIKEEIAKVQILNPYELVTPALTAAQAAAVPPMPPLRPLVPVQPDVVPTMPALVARPALVPLVPARPIPMPSAMSWTRMETIGQCGMKERIKRDPDVFNADRPSWALVGGSAVDAVINEICGLDAGKLANFDARAVFLATLTLEIVKREKDNPAFPAAMWSTGSKNEGEAWWRENGAVMCQNYLPWHLARLNDGWICKAFQVDLTGSYIAGRPFVGYIDAVWIHPPTGTVEILDAKTGSTPANPMQVKTYAVALCGMPEWNALLEGATSIKLATYDARKAVHIDRGDGSPGRLVGLVEYLVDNAWRTYEQQIWTPTTLVTGLGSCNGCSVKPVCPIGGAL